MRTAVLAIALVAAIAAGSAHAQVTAGTGAAATGALSVTASLSPATPRFNQFVTATVTVANSGSDAATNVVVTGTVTSGVQARSMNGAGCSFTTSGFRCAVASLAGGGSATITYSFDADVAGSLAFSANASSDNAGSDVATVNTTVSTASADAAASLSAPTTAANGAQVQYRVALTNNGPDPVKSITGTLQLPASVSAPTSFSFPGGFQSCTVAGATVCGATPFTVRPDMMCWFPGTGGPRSVTCKVSDGGLIGPGGSGGSGQFGMVNVTASALGPAVATLTTAATPGQTDGNTTNDSQSVTTQIAPSANLDVVVTAPGNEVVGNTFTYAFTVSNAGPDTATAASLSVALPANVSLVSAPPGCTGTGPVVCALGDIAAGTGVRRSISVAGFAAGPAVATGTATSGVADNVASNNTASAATSITLVPLPPGVDVALQASLSPASPHLNEFTTATFAVTNNGPDAATNVVVTGALPAGVQLRSMSGPGCSFTGSPFSGFRCTIASLGNLESKTITVGFDADVVGSITASASVTTSSTDRDASNDSASATITVRNANADIAVSLSAPLAVASGAQIEYGLSITNNGPDPVKAATGTVQLPANVSTPPSFSFFGGFQSCTVAGATVCGASPFTARPTTMCWFPGTGGPRSVSCKVSDGGLIGPGGSGGNGGFANIRVNAAGTGAATATATVDPQTGVTDGGSGNNSSSATTAVTAPGQVDLELTGTAPAAATVNTTFDYVLATRNMSGTPATGVTLSAPIAASLQLVSTSGATCTGTATVSCDLGTIGAGGTKSVTIRLRGTAAGSAALSASVSSVEPDADPSDNATSAAVLVRQPTSDIAVTPSVPATVEVTRSFTLSFQVTNNGPDSAGGVRVRGALPAGMTVASFGSSGCFTSGSGFDCPLSTLFPGSTSFVSVALVGSQVGMQSIPITVTQQNVDPDPTNDAQTVSIDVRPRPTADVSVQLDAPASATLGDTVTFTVTAVNDGPDTATGVVINAAFAEAAFSDETVSAPAGGTCGISHNSGSLGGEIAGMVLCSIPSLAADATFTATVTVRTAAAGSFLLYALAAGSGLQVDPDATNGSTTTTITVQPPLSIVCGPDLSATTDPGLATAAVTLTAPTASGGAGDAVVSGTRSDGGALDAPYPIGETVITWTATGSGAQPAGCLQRVTVVDDEAPTAALAAPAPADWQPAAVTLHVTAADNSGAVESVRYRIAGVERTAAGATADITVSADGETTVTFWAVDAAGNESDRHDALVRVDQTAPIASLAPSGPSGDNGWFVGATSVAAGATDATSGIAALELSTDGGSTFAPYTSPIQLGDGSHDVVLRALDRAGNVATAQATVRVDTIAPAVTLSPAGPAGLNGWFVGDVTVGAAASDATSGVARIVLSRDGGASFAPATSIVLGDGVHDVVARAVDQAGNVGTAAATVRVDQTRPTISAARSPQANANGWNNGPVTVSFTCADGGAGLASCTPPVVLGADGANQQATGTAVDAAGNTATATLGGISIDSTAPTITFTGNRGTYVIGDTVEIGCTAADPLSGLASDTCVPFSKPAADLPAGLNTITATATDRAGNTTTATATFTVVIDGAGLCALTEAAVTKAGVANGLCASLRAADEAKARGNDAAKRGAINAYLNQLQAQTNKAISAADAERLAALAERL